MGGMSPGGKGGGLRVSHMVGRLPDGQTVTFTISPTLRNAVEKLVDRHEVPGALEIVREEFRWHLYKGDRLSGDCLEVVAATVVSLAIGSDWTLLEGEPLWELS